MKGTNASTAFSGSKSWLFSSQRFFVQCTVCTYVIRTYIHTYIYNVCRYVFRNCMHKYIHTCNNSVSTYILYTLILTTKRHSHTTCYVCTYICRVLLNYNFISTQVATRDISCVKCQHGNKLFYEMTCGNSIRLNVDFPQDVALDLHT